MTWRRPPRTAWVLPAADDACSAWVLDADKNTIFSFSAVAFLVWEAADGADGVDEVVETLVETQGWDRDEIAEAVDQFVQVLVHQDFLKEVSA